MESTRPTTLAASQIVQASPGFLFLFAAFNNSASAQFVQVHDAAALPSDGAVPLLVFPIGPASTIVFDFGVMGVPCNTGITLCNSTTGPTKTLGAANCLFTAVYR